MLTAFFDLNFKGKIENVLEMQHGSVNKLIRTMSSLPLPLPPYKIKPRCNGSYDSANDFFIYIILNILKWAESGNRN